MSDSISLIGGVITHMLGLRRAAQQDQLAADLANQAATNQAQANRAQAGQRVTSSQPLEINPEFDPAAPPRRGQIVDISA